MNRRSFLSNHALAAFSTFALLREARANGVIGGRLTAKRWIDRQDELARVLKAGSISQLSWHNDIKQLAAEVDVLELVTEISRAAGRHAGEPFMRDPVKRTIRFIGENERRAGCSAMLIWAAANADTVDTHFALGSSRRDMDARSFQSAPSRTKT